MVSVSTQTVWGTPVVTVDGQPLPKVDGSFGYEWGYIGRGPSALALAILTHFLGGNETLARAFRIAFKEAVVARLPQDGWRLTGQEIAAWLRKEMRARVMRHCIPPGLDLPDEVILPRWLLEPAPPVAYEGRRV